MKKFQNIIAHGLSPGGYGATFSGAALTAQAAEPRPYNQQWEHQDNDRHRDNHNDKKDKNDKTIRNIRTTWKKKKDPANRNT